MINNVWVRPDGRVVAVHPSDQAVAFDAYGDCEVVSMPATDILAPVRSVYSETGEVRVDPIVLSTSEVAKLPKAVPARISKVGLRRALREAGKLAAFDAALAQGDETAQDDYAAAAEFSTGDAILSDLLKAAKVSDAKRVEIFRRAIALVA